MKVFMLGWEFPPHISGGLGTACFGLTKGLNEIGVQIYFVLPDSIPIDATSHVKFKTPDHLSAEGDVIDRDAGRVFEHVQLHRVAAFLLPYGTPEAYGNAVKKFAARRAGKKSAGAAMPAGTFAPGGSVNYEGDLMGQIRSYARLAVELSSGETFDVVHAHDWMTFPAGLATAAAARKPLVVHVHSTEFDRSGRNVNRRICEIERAGMLGADCVVCVSHLTCSIIAERYRVPADKIEVVYNAVDVPATEQLEMKPIGRNEKIVLFLGRVTMQKGPEYFLQAAKKVVEKHDNVRFVIAGSGDMIARCVQLAADLKLGKYVTFTGFLRGTDVDRVFRMADLYVMPSVSEPFGIAPLEAISHNVPVIISKQSGVSEVLTHVLKVDFWDIDEMANKILAVLRHPPLQRTLRQHGHIELRKLSWQDSAKQLKKIYSRLIRAHKHKAR